MQTLAETDATPGALTSGTRVAAALAAGASLLHWIGTDNTDTHSWSGDALVSLVAGAALMGLAIVLVARPRSVRTARAVYLVGAVGTAVVVMAVLLPLLSGATSGHAGNAAHSGHDAGGAEGIASADAIRAALELVLIGVLAWMYRMTGRAHPDGH
jgi:hypothetical protein